MNKKIRKEYDFFKLFDSYISVTRRGKRLQKNGKRVKKETYRKYYYVRRKLVRFCEHSGFQLRLISANKMNKREFKAERKYWKKFYHEFTDFLYYKENSTDNYVCMIIKAIRSFCIYLNQDVGLNIGTFYKNFYTRADETEIIVLSPERLNFLIYDQIFENKLSPKLKIAKDIFVLGCTVALRVSDLMRLNPTHLERINNQVYLSIKSQKTQTYTRLRLPQYAIDIIEKYRNKISLLPWVHNTYLNIYIKQLMEQANWVEPIEKIRHKRGIPVTLYKDPATKEQFRFCDMITSHTMRRTAITTMLSLGMNEQLVRKVSGHTPNSKEFYKYVAYSQPYLDKELEMVYQKLKEKRLEPV